jgi:hypothetical protein
MERMKKIKYEDYKNLRFYLLAYVRWKSLHNVSMFLVTNNGFFANQVQCLLLFTFRGCEVSEFFTIGDKMLSSI